VQSEYDNLSLNNDMTPEMGKSELLFARPQLLRNPPKRETLRLSDGYLTSVYVHDPPTAPKRLPVVYLHGIQSHPGWFVGSAGYLAGLGYPVFQVTRRGSGANTLNPGHAESAQQLLDDVAIAVQFAKQRIPSDRVHLLGVSWGGKLAACYATDLARQGQLASLTMIAPGIVPKIDLSPLAKTAVAFSVLLNPRRLFDIPLDDAALFTENPVMLDYLRKDSHRLHQATARFLYSSRNLDRMLRSARPGALQLPTTLIPASNDRIVNNPETERLVSVLAGKSLVVKRVVGCHTLEFEPDTRDFFKALTEAFDRAD